MTGGRPQDSNIENFVGENASLITQQVEENPDTDTCLRRIYKCKDCDKAYDNFQALGGHRASHRIIKPETRSDGSLLDQFQETPSNVNLHACKICKTGFSIGQALGGHMRKHWRENFKDGEKGLLHEDNDRTRDTMILPYRSDDSSSSSSSSSSSIVSNFNGNEVFRYDLNLTPEENEAMNAVPLL